MQALLRLCRLPMTRCLVLFLSAVLASPWAWAMDIPTYDKQIKTPPNSPAQVRLNIYLLGLAEGLKLANVTLAARNQTPLFCTPETTNMFAADYRKIIDASLANSRPVLEGLELSIEGILMRALQDSYPCPPR